MIDYDIIVSIATAKAESAIGIIRMSGKGCIEIADDIFKSAKNKTLSQSKDRTITYGHIFYDNRVYDEVMALYMKKPQTYTREDMVEIYTHGNYSVMQDILNILISKGARISEAGEFTKRAFLNGRLDLSQAEAVMDMVSSKTKTSMDIAINHLEGKYSKHIDDMCEILTELMAKIEVCIDYPDEDIEIISTNDIYTELLEIQKQLLNLIESYDAGRIIKEGLKISIIGKANVGKSSLLNNILREDRAIVTHIAGTTRDVIEENANIRGIPVTLMDTAGMRDTDDYIEKLGIEKSKKSLNLADLIILLVDASVNFEKDLVYDLFKDIDKIKIICINKIDLIENKKIEQLKEKLQEYLNISKDEIVTMSVIENQGIENLLDLIENKVISGNIDTKESNIVTNARHYEAIYNAKQSVDNAIVSIEAKLPLDILEMDLSQAYMNLGEIVGKSVGEDVITRIFEKFCLGK